MELLLVLLLDVVLVLSSLGANHPTNINAANAINHLRLYKGFLVFDMTGLETGGVGGLKLLINKD